MTKGINRAPRVLPLFRLSYEQNCTTSFLAEEDRLWAIGGTNVGTFGYFPINYKKAKATGSPEAIFEGGHAGLLGVWCLCPADLVEPCKARPFSDGRVVKMAACVARYQAHWFQNHQKPEDKLYIVLTRNFYVLFCSTQPII
ncbi:WD repeat-containing protein-like protein [Forsythia ovata]|uniref:WD repeat-containing protein-like protein n=1 Tax=Forsythia ovata TaxID=205694 RepID=A0ABD1T881_9LAMI